jgi:hypothetical protein
VLYESNDVATNGAASTVPDLPFDVDRKSVVTATSWARPATINPAAKSYAAPFSLVFDRHPARLLDQIFEVDRAVHARAPSRDGTAALRAQDRRM